ncbi:uncharacterized protein LOC125576901 [Brassica napus]|uniref:uncharacterized protein LOC125576901 n=1 Tax=Brassica napus TaxID=3708 RepID=UPI0020786F7C|nr:uncharacterized protein LOC125576901 [Brassica napus]
MSSLSSDEVEERLDEIIDDIIDETYINILEAQPSKPKKRAYIERDREIGHNRLWNDYFSEDAKFPPYLFRRRFRMNKELFLRIVHRLSEHVPFFQRRRDAMGRFGLSPLQKCTAAIRLLAYGSAADAVDEYLRVGESTAISCLKHFNEGIIQLFGNEYLRRPTEEDLQRLLHIGEIRGFPGMVGSIDCMHWRWKNCPTAWKGQYTRGSTKPSIVLEAVASQDLWIWHAFFGLPGRAPRVEYVVNGHMYNLAYYLTDGPKAELFAKLQESTRKDVERAFGVLQA